MARLSDKPAIAHLVEICFQRGLRRVILSPGSRNAPLSISFLGHGGFDVRVVGDERVAGFMALGMSQLDGVPTILVCTSGSAMLNYSPAVSEAFYQRIPLLIITADRPEEWVDQMEGQTMRQRGALSNFLVKEFHLPQEAQERDRLWYSDRMVNEAITATTHLASGPVHINIPLKEPLYGLVEKNVAEEVKVITPLTESQKGLNSESLEQLLAELKTYDKVMLIVGLSSPSQEKINVLQQLQSAGVVVLTETSSNAVLSGSLSCIDRCLAHIPATEHEDYLPELVISIGGPLVSKRIKTILREATLSAHWHIDPYAADKDLFQQLTRSISAEPVPVLNSLVSAMIPIQSDYSKRWESLMASATLVHKRYITNSDFSDLKAYSQIVEALPSMCKVQMANSAAVRYVQIFGDRVSMTCYANRGVSGIDGCTSTAMGMTVLSKEPVVLLTGDMAFRYDANAFWQKEIPQGLKCIVINNGGGGIFRFIDGPDKTEHLDTAFEAHQKNSAKGIADLYSLPYLLADDTASLDKGLWELFSNEQTMVLEVFTPREENAEVLRSYFKALKQH